MTVITARQSRMQITFVKKTQDVIPAPTLRIDALARSANRPMKNGKNMSMTFRLSRFTIY